MAESKKRVNPQVTVSGNVAYQLNQAQVAPERKRQVQPKPPKTEPKREPQRRPRVAVREKQAVSLFGVTGFLVVGVVMALVLTSYVQLNDIYAQTHSMESRLSALETEYGILEVEYNNLFDTVTLTEAAQEAGLVTPSASQKVYLELEGTDNAVVYAPQEEPGFFQQLGDGIQAIWRSLFS